MKRRHVWAIAGATAAVVLLATAVLLNSSTKVTVGQVRSANERQPVDAIDHSAWNRLLGKYVDPQGLVNYAGWKASAEDLAALDAYLAERSRAEVSERSRTDGRLAFWTNAFNALCLRGVLRDYPNAPARSPWFWEYHIHRDLLLIVGDKRYSLNDIHNQLVALNEPLAFLAVDCLYQNGPFLRNNAYLLETVTAQLAETARLHFAQPNRLKADPAKNELSIGPAVELNEGAFGKSLRAAAAALSPYLPDPESQRLANSPSTTLRYLPLDGRLNDQSLPQESNP